MIGYMHFEFYMIVDIIVDVMMHVKRRKKNRVFGGRQLPMMENLN
jgi:hypothetical protein